MSEGLGVGRVTEIDGEGKTMADGCGWEVLAMTLVVWIMAALAGRWHHG